MRLFVQVPVFHKNPELVAKRLSAFADWWAAGVLQRILDRFGASHVAMTMSSPGGGFTLAPDTDPVVVTLSDKPGSLVPKGLLVRLSLVAALHVVDEADVASRDNAYFILIDGSGAFDFESIFRIIERFHAEPRIDVVFGTRPQDDTGMAPWRRHIELFEEFLLTERFSDRLLPLAGIQTLPDSQAGCWGVRLGAMKSLPLSANGYGLEYDLLVSTLASGLQCRFEGPLSMRPRAPGDSGFGDGKTIDATAVRTSIRKLRFIRHRLDLRPDAIVRHLDTYLDMNRNQEIQLPMAYIDGVRGAFKDSY